MALKIVTHNNQKIVVSDSMKPKPGDKVYHRLRGIFTYSGELQPVLRVLLTP
jgi:hypothetical protein